MDRYIGLDAHLGSCTFAVMSETGRRLREERVETDAKALRAFIRTIGGTRHLCLEESALSEWLYELLEPEVAEAVVVQPVSSRGNKSDALDAWARAEDLRVGSRQSRRVYKAPGQFRSLREAVRTYDALGQDQQRVKLRLRAVLTGRGIQGFGRALYDPSDRVVWIQTLPASYQRRARMLGDTLDRLTDMVEEARDWLLDEAGRTRDVQLVMTAPGFGPIRAARLVAHVVTPHRFRAKRPFWSYCGLGINVRSSSDWRRRGQSWERREIQQIRGLNKQCNRALKNVFKGATVSLIQHGQDPLSASYHALVAQGRKPNLARLTIARRLAAGVLAAPSRKDRRLARLHPPLSNS